MLPLGCVLPDCVCVLLRIGAAPGWRGPDLHTGGRSPGGTGCRLTPSVDLTAFERCDRHHKLLFEYSIIFWTTHPRRRRAAKHTPPILTGREIERLMAAARAKSRCGHRDATMILIGYRHGLRASELCDLQRSHVESQNHGATWCGWIGNGILARAPIRPNRDSRVRANASRAVRHTLSLMAERVGGAPTIGRPIIWRERGG